MINPFVTGSVIVALVLAFLGKLASTLTKK